MPPKKSKKSQQNTMSTKTSKRRMRRTNTNENDGDKKIEDTIDQSDDNKSSISTDTDKDSSFKEENIIFNNSEVDFTKPYSEMPVLQDESEEIVEISNGFSPSESKELVEQVNGQSNNEIIEIDEPVEEIMEPLNLDADESELQFTNSEFSEPSSDPSEADKSPILTRCKTRRSHTRNIPTPKTPKVSEINGESDKISEEQAENISVVSNESLASSFSEQTQESDLTNASIIVNFGNDTTKNCDITITSNGDDDPSLFLEQTKDKSYGETLRCISGRKTLRNINYQPTKYFDMTDSSKKYTPSTGLKRRSDDDMPAEKRAKTENSPGFLSYLTSPFKRTIHSEISSSTPKPRLMSFNYFHKGSTVIDEVTDINVEPEEKKPVAEQPYNKWCSIM